MRPPTFETYLRRLGLHDRPQGTAAQLRADRQAAAAAGDRVRQAFRKRGVRKAASG